MSKSTLPSVEAYKTLSTGITQNFPAKVPIILLGESFTPAQLSARIQARVDKSAATDAARAAYRTAVKEERLAEADVRPLRQAFRGLITGRLGADSEELTKYGFAPRNARKVSAAAKAQATAQAAATRKARNPLTKQEKKKLKGVVGAPPAPATSPSPAGATTGGAPAVPPTPTPAVQNGTTPANGGTTQVNGH